MQKQQDGKERAPLGGRALRAHKYVADDQLAARVQTALELEQEGRGFQRRRERGEHWREIRYRIPAAGHLVRNPPRRRALVSSYRLLREPDAQKEERGDARRGSLAGADNGDKKQSKKFPAHRRHPTAFWSGSTIIFRPDKERSPGHRDPDCEAIAQPCSDRKQKASASQGVAGDERRGESAPNVPGVISGQQGNRAASGETTGSENAIGILSPCFCIKPRPHSASRKISHPAALPPK